MHHNADQETSPSTLTMPNIVNSEAILPLPSCDKKKQLKTAALCLSCTSQAQCDSCTTKVIPLNGPETSRGTTLSKRGYKSHVPSACINCKTAHLACDVSRPCQRCVTLNKTETCQDIQHKKRGRPKLRDKKIYSSNEHTYEILYGTIQSPSITTKSPTRKIVPNIQAPPFKTKISNISKPKSTISFIHEPMESFQSHTTPPSVVPEVASVPLTYDDLLLESMIPQLNTPSREPFLFDYNTNLFENNALLPTKPALEDNTKNLTIIMSMEICCAKVCDDTIKCWGYYPQELAHRSFYDFISPKDIDRLARLHRLLLDNVMNTAGDGASLPPTERTTSTVFSTTDADTLSQIAHGSRSFSDTIHIKKRSGEYELYKLVVYIGGGLGANLYDITSFSKQYIVAQFRKHEYEVIPAPPSGEDLFKNADTFYSPVEPMAVFSPMLPLSPVSPNNALSKFKKTEKDTKSDIFKENSLLNKTRKFSQMPIIPPRSPKFNIAPVTSASVTPPTLSFQQNKHLSSLFQKFPPSPSASMRLGSGYNGPVTHPAQQYFLQTSSSTLNAEASAVNTHSRLNKSGVLRTEGVDTNRKMEMSIRSLLC